MAGRRKKHADVPDAEIVAEVVASPGVRVHGPPVPVAVQLEPAGVALERKEAGRPSSTSHPGAVLSAVLGHVVDRAPELGELVSAGRQAVEGAQALAAALEALGLRLPRVPNPPRRRR